MTDEWNESAKSWDDDPYARAYANAAFAGLEELVLQAGVALKGSAVLDFGCGTGLLTEHLVSAGATVEAIDTSESMLAVLRAKINRLGWQTVRPSSMIPNDRVRFDVIVCSSVCAFLDDYPSDAKQLVSLLKPGGLFVQWDWERSGDDDHGLTRDEIDGALVGAGLMATDVQIGFTIKIEGQTMSPLVGFGQRPNGDAT